MAGQFDVPAHVMKPPPETGAQQKGKMIYREFVKKFGIHLDAEKDRIFTDRALSEWGGWSWWDAKPFRDDGLCRDKSTNLFYRFTSHVEKRRTLNWRIYTVGKRVRSAHLTNLSLVYIECARGVPFHESKVERWRKIKPPPERGTTERR